MTERIIKKLAKIFIIVSFIAVIIIIYNLTTLTSCIIALSKQMKWKRRQENIKERDILSPKIACDVQGSPKALKQEHDHQDIPESKTSRWVRIGEVTNLHTYPLISGKAYAADECQVTFEKMKMFKEGKLIKWDRSFVVYEMTYKYIITTGNFPELSEVCVSIEKDGIILEAASMSTIYVELSDRKSVECTFWSNTELQTLAKIACVDCGDEAARWLSRFLCGRDIGLRLGYSINTALTMDIYWQHWFRNCILLQKVKCHMYSLNPFVNVLYSIVISSASYNKMSQTLNVYKPNEMICPNIIIFASNLYEKEIWEWIKIGNVIIRNTQPLVIWPREVTKSEDIRLFGFGVNCKVYLPGCVKLGDDVYLHTKK